MTERQQKIRALLVSAGHDIQAAETLLDRAEKKLAQARELEEEQDEVSGRKEHREEEHGG